MGAFGSTDAGARFNSEASAALLPHPKHDDRPAPATRTEVKSGGAYGWGAVGLALGVLPHPTSKSCPIFRGVTQPGHCRSPCVCPKIASRRDLPLAAMAKPAYNWRYRRQTSLTARSSPGLPHLQEPRRRLDPPRPGPPGCTLTVMAPVAVGCCRRTCGATRRPAAGGSLGRRRGGGRSAVAKAVTPVVMALLCVPRRPVLWRRSPATRTPRTSGKRAPGHLCPP